MTTAYITIGNSDNKLTQAQWAEYVKLVYRAVSEAVAGGAAVHFDGYSLSSSPWQNAAWALGLPDEPRAHARTVARLRSELGELAGAYNQDSIAWAEATVEFLPAVPRSSGGQALTVTPAAAGDHCPCVAGT